MASFTEVLCLCAMVVAIVQSDGARSRLVYTTEGLVRGYADPNEGIFTFYGIPYAKTPTGPNRFQAPDPPLVRSQTLEAVDKGIVCPQIAVEYMNLDSKTIQEDCLIANIYVPDTEEQNLPVAVFIHGGFFHLGYGDSMSPKSFVKDKKIIAVTFNYRLGINGFLCLGTKDVPGNAGLKDQVALLRWVQKNIAAFGGNPQDVSLAGCSAGAISADLLTLSKSTKGLFSRVLIESGSNLCPITIQTDPLEKAKNYAKKVNFTQVDDISKLEEFYKNAPLDLLTVNTFTDDVDDFHSVFSPCVDNKMGEYSILHDAPANILKNGDYTKLPMLYGFANMEGLMTVYYFQHWAPRMNEKFSDFLPPNLQFENESVKEEVAKAVKHFYFGEKPVSVDTILQYIDYFTDIFFVYPALQSTKLQVEAGNDQVFLYEYSYIDDNTPFIPYTEVRGADHCSETIAVLFDTISNRTGNVTDDYKNHTNIIMKEMWYNFMQTGKPVPEGSSLPAWPAAGADRAPHMSLGQKVQLEGSLRQNRTLFWDDIYQQYYHSPETPPK